MSHRQRCERNGRMWSKRRRPRLRRARRNLAKSSDESSVRGDILRSERDSAATCHHELIASIARVIKASKERKNKAAETLVKFRKTMKTCVRIRWRRTWEN